MRVGLRRGRFLRRSSSQNLNDIIYKQFNLAELGLDLTPSSAPRIIPFSFSFNNSATTIGKIVRSSSKSALSTSIGRFKLSLKTLSELFQIPQAKGVLVYDALEGDRIHEPPVDATGFYSKFLRVGVGVLIHPFFIFMLKIYGIAPAQLNPIAWCHMLGVFLLWDDLGFGVPSLNVWHYLYMIHLINDQPYFYYFTKRASGRV